MRVLVTGGGGFIGSNLVEALLKRGDDVRVLDNFSTGRRQNLAAADEWARAGNGQFTLIEGDVRDVDTVARAVSGCDAVLHQAAIASVPRSVADPLTSHQVNSTGTLNMLMAARDAGVKRFVFASSSSVYGESPTLPKVETMPSAPISPYALDKLYAETHCRLFRQLYGLGTVALRYFNVFGARQDPASAYAAVVPRFVTAQAKGQAPVIYGDGQQTRDFTYIENVVQVNLLAASCSDEATGEAYNVACGERASLLELASLIGRLVGKEVPPVHEPGRPGDIRDSLASIDKARRLLGYEPRVTLAEGMKPTVAHFLEAGA